MRSIATILSFCGAYVCGKDREDFPRAFESALSRLKRIGAPFFGEFATIPQDIWTAVSNGPMDQEQSERMDDLVHKYLMQFAIAEQACHMILQNRQEDMPCLYDAIIRTNAIDTRILNLKAEFVESVRGWAEAVNAAT